MLSPKNLCLTQGHNGFSPIFTSGSFILLGFTVKSTIHFELTVIRDMKEEVLFLFLSFFFFFCIRLCSASRPCFEDYFRCYCHVFAPLSQMNRSCTYGCISGRSVLPCQSLLMPISRPRDSCSFIISPDSGNVPAHSLLLLQSCFV